MKKSLFTLTLSLALVVHAEDLKLLTGRTLAGVTISRIEPDGLIVMTDDGIEKVPFAQLPPETRAKFGYDPEKAAQFSAALQQAAAQRSALTSAGEAAERAAAAQRAALVKQEAPAPVSNVTAPAAGNPLDTRSAPTGQKFSIVGTLLQKHDDGMLVACEPPKTSGHKKAVGVVFLTGYPGAAGMVDGEVIKCTAVESGTLAYSSIDGGRTTAKTFAFWGK